MILAANRCRDRSPNVYIADGFSEIEGILNPRPGDVAWAVGPGFMDAWRLTESDAEPDGFDSIQSNACEYVWQRSGDFVNVALFDAVPNTGEDQSEFFARAVAAAPEGSTLVVPSGIFILDNLKITKSVSLFLTSGATLKMASAATGPMLEWTVDTTGGLYGPGTIDGNAAGQTQPIWYAAVQTRTATKFTVRDVTFQNCSRFAIHDDSSTGTVEICHCQFLNNSEHGGVTTIKDSMALFMAGVGMQLFVHHCRFVQDDYPSAPGKAPGGIIAASCKLVNICDNYFFRVGQSFLLNHIASIHIYEGCDSVTLSRNTIIEPLWDGIVFQNSYHLIATDNQISGLAGNGSLGTRGIWFNPTQRNQVAGPRGGIISHNIIHDMELAAGIFAHAATANAGRIIISENDIESTLNGIRVSGFIDTPALFEEPILIHGNTVKCLANGYGIRLEEVSGLVLVRSNNVRATGGGGTAHAFLAATGLELADIDLIGNYFKADTVGFYAAVMRGMRRLSIHSGIFSNTGVGATAYTVGADFDLNPVQLCMINSDGITVEAGFFTVVTAEITAWARSTISLGINPNGNIQAPQGSRFVRISGGAGTSFYVKEGPLIGDWVAK